MNRLTLIATALAMAALPAMAAPPEIRWARSWDEALKEAKDRNVPIHVAVHKDDSPDCATMAGSVFTSKEFIVASKNWVNVYCNRDTAHGVAKVEGKDVCKLFPAMGCADHVACEKAVSAQFFKGAIAAPGIVWCDADGKEIGQFQGAMTAKALLEKMAAAVKKVGPGLALDDWLAAIGHLADGDKAVTDNLFTAAILAYSAVLKISKVPGAKTVVARAQAGLDRVNEQGMLQFQHAQEKVAAKDVKGAREELTKISATFKGLPAAKEADKALAKIEEDEKNKRMGDGNRR